jgi:hypothetical protein
MEGANYFKMPDIKREHRMEIEESHDTNHSILVNQYIQSRRTLNSNPLNQIIRENRYSLPTNFNDKPKDVIKTMNEIISLIYKINDFFTIKIEDRKENIKLLLNKLKGMRKELSKENIPVSKMINLLNNGVQNFIEALTELLSNNLDENLQLEALWIINNLIFFILKYKDNNAIFFDANKITNKLQNYLNKLVQRDIPKYDLIEKIFRIIGNLICINISVIEIVINNNILSFIINCLNNPVPLFRSTCLWLLNKVIIFLRKNSSNADDYINRLCDDNSIKNYVSLFSRIKNHISLDEISEFFWLICELVKNKPNILIPLFFMNNNNININNYDNIDNEAALNNFKFILDNCLTQKMTQVCFRMISNLLVVCYNDIKSEYLLTKFIECFFEKKFVLLYINDVLNSTKNKFDISFVIDVLVLIFNLICFSPIKSSIFFRKGIVNLISDRDYHVNKEVMKLLFINFYRILFSTSFSFEPNDEKVVRTCLTIIKRFRDNDNILIVFIDILYFYLKASKTNINYEIENELTIAKNKNNVSNPEYNSIFNKLAEIVKMSSPLSKFMRNV